MPEHNLLLCRVVWKKPKKAKAQTLSAQICLNANHHTYYIVVSIPSRYIIICQLSILVQSCCVVVVDGKGFFVSEATLFQITFVGQFYFWPVQGWYVSAAQSLKFLYVDTSSQIHFLHCRCTERDAKGFDTRCFRSTKSLVGFSIVIKLLVNNMLFEQKLPTLLTKNQRETLESFNYP